MQPERRRPAQALPVLVSIQAYSILAALAAPATPLRSRAFAEAGFGDPLALEPVGYAGRVFAFRSRPGRGWDRGVIACTIEQNVEDVFAGQAAFLAGSVTLGRDATSEDFYLNHVSVGHVIEVHLDTGVAATRRLLARGIVRSIEPDGADRFRIGFSGPVAEALARPVPRPVFFGTGAEPVELAGQAHPLALGDCFNVPAVLIDAAAGLYRFHAALPEMWRGSSVLPPFTMFAWQVRERGIPVARTRSQGGELIELWSNPSPGVLKLNFQPDGEITVDAAALPAQLPAVGELTRMLWVYARPVVRNIYGPSAQQDDSFVTVGATLTARAGLVALTGEALTFAEAFADLLAPFGGFIRENADGSGSLARVLPPTGATVAILTDRDLTQIAEMPPLPEFAQALGSVEIEYARNWSPRADMTEARDPATGAVLVSFEDARRLRETSSVYARGFSRLAAIQGVIQTERLEETVLADLAAAEAAADFAASWRAVPRRRFRLQTPFWFEDWRVGQEIRIEHPAVGAAGLNATILRLVRDPVRGLVDMTVVG